MSLRNQAKKTSKTGKIYEPTTAQPSAIAIEQVDRLLSWLTELNCFVPNPIPIPSKSSLLALSSDDSFSKLVEFITSTNPYSFSTEYQASVDHNLKEIMDNCRNTHRSLKLMRSKCTAQKLHRINLQSTEQTLSETNQLLLNQSCEISSICEFLHLHSDHPNITENDIIVVENALRGLALEKIDPTNEVNEFRDSVKQSLQMPLDTLINALNSIPQPKTEVVQPQSTFNSNEIDQLVLSRNEELLSLFLKTETLQKKMNTLRKEVAESKDKQEKWVNLCRNPTSIRELLQLEQQGAILEGLTSNFIEKSSELKAKADVTSLILEEISTIVTECNEVESNIREFQSRISTLDSEFDLLSTEINEAQLMNADTWKHSILPACNKASDLCTSLETLVHQRHNALAHFEPESDNLEQTTTNVSWYNPQRASVPLSLAEAAKDTQKSLDEQYCALSINAMHTAYSSDANGFDLTDTKSLSLLTDELHSLKKCEEDWNSTCGDLISQLSKIQTHCDTVEDEISFSREYPTQNCTPWTKVDGMTMNEWVDCIQSLQHKLKVLSKDDNLE